MQQSTNSRSQEKALTAELEDDQRLLATVVRAHLETCDFTRDKVEPMLIRARTQPSFTACPPTLVSTDTYESKIRNMVIPSALKTFLNSLQRAFENYKDYLKAYAGSQKNSIHRLTNKVLYTGGRCMRSNVTRSQNALKLCRGKGHFHIYYTDTSAFV